MSDQTVVGLHSHDAMQNEIADIVILVNSIPALVAYIDCNMVLQFCNQPYNPGLIKMGN